MYDYQTLRERFADATVDPVSRAGDDPLLLLFTSGTTGRPKGIVHRTGGYLAYVDWTSREVFDLDRTDTVWTAASVAWIVAYTVYGPLSVGATTVLYEGALDTPEPDRPWEIVDDHEVTVFYTATERVESFRDHGERYPARHDLSTLDVAGMVGEPVDPATWRWYDEHVGDDDCHVLDTWWQSETGGVMISIRPGVEPPKPGRAGPPLPGIEAVAVDDDGTTVNTDEIGSLLLQRPWPGMLLTLLDGSERYEREYWASYSEPEADEWVYAPEDAVRIDGDGYVEILGRADDVIELGERQLVATRVESAVTALDGVEAAAVVERRSTAKNCLVVFVVPTADGVTAKQRTETDRELHARVADRVAETAGTAARPGHVHSLSSLPETASGKLERHVLSEAANTDELDDWSGIDGSIRHLGFK